MDKMQVGVARNVHESTSHGQNAGRSVLKCPRERFSWTKRGQESLEMSSRVFLVDKTWSGEVRNVHESTSHGQNAGRSVKKCPRERFSWTKHGQEKPEMSSRAFFEDKP